MRFTALLLTAIIACPLIADEKDEPEAAQMFERLVKRIPTSIDAHDVHEYVGKPFNYVFNAGNASEVEVQLAPFWISERLYCIHRTLSKAPILAVYLIHDADNLEPPHSEAGKRAYDQFKPLQKHRGAGSVCDLHAAVDHGVTFEPAEFSYKVVYTSTTLTKSRE